MCPTIDEFFRGNYRRMVGYCTSFGYIEPDVEEVVADVILRRFDEYMEKLNGDINTTRRWMNRRVLLDLKARHRSRDRAETGLEAERMGDTMSDDVAPPSTIHYDTPEAIACLAQRLPPVPPILLDYEQWEGYSGTGGTRVASTNTPNDRVRFCRARKKFMDALTG